MASTFLVSFIIPTHNRAHCLEKAVRSAHESGAGGHFELELIVVDDCSTDDTPQVCERLAQELPNFKVVRHTTSQGPAGRNSGIALSRGKYLAFLDDDDLRLPGSLPAQIALLEANPEAGFCYGPVQVANAEMEWSGELQPAEPPQGDLFWQLLEENFVRVPSVVVRRTALDQVGPFDLQLWGTEDYDLWVRLAERFAAVAVTEPVAVYRQCNVTTEQISANHAALVRSAATLLEKWLKLPRAAQAEASLVNSVRRKFKHRRVHLLRSTACQCLEAGMRRAARRDLEAAWELDPDLARSLGVPRLWLRSWLPIRGVLRKRKTPRLERAVP